MKIVSGVIVGMMVGCAAPATEQVSTQASEQAATTYRFSGSLPDEGETCRKHWAYRNSLCGTSFRGYTTIPNVPNPDYPNALYETPYDEQGLGIAPYGMVLHVDGQPPRVFPFVTVEIANDIRHPLTPEDPSLVDRLQISASASYSNDGFSASFLSPTATAIDDEDLMPDPARFSDVCWDSWEGCPFVVGDAAADLLSIDLHWSRSPVVVAVPRDDGSTPYFFITATDWIDADHTAVSFTVEIFDAFTFATPTCDLWVQLEEAEGAEPHAVQGIVRHDGQRQQRAVLTIETGSPNPARQFDAVNVTCGFSIPGEALVESSSIWY